MQRGPRPHRRSRGRGSGATLISVCAGLSIVGLLAAAVVPRVVQARAQSRTVEPVRRLAALYRRSANVGWQASLRNGGAGLPADALPPSVGMTPAQVPMGVRVKDPPGTWVHPTWRTLEFSIEDEHAYSYAYDSAVSETVARFTARAVGDLDGDGVLGTFERTGEIDARGAVHDTRGLFVQRGVE